MRQGLFVLLFLFFTLVGSVASAHPVSYQGAVSVMTWNQPYFTDFWTTYSYLPNAAVAAREMRMTMRDGSEMKVFLPQADFLLYRRNARTFQANVYAYGGYGVERLERNDSHAAAFGAEADAESRKYYGAASYQALIAGEGADVYSTTLRAGLAAYPAEFDDLGTWLIVAYQHNGQLTQRDDVTPMVRLMYRNMLTEVGSSFAGNWMLNFMVHF
jgi:hypothetical protein